MGIYRMCKRKIYRNASAKEIKRSKIPEELSWFLIKRTEIQRIMLHLDDFAGLKMFWHIWHSDITYPKSPFTCKFIANTPFF